MKKIYLILSLVVASMGLFAQGQIMSFDFDTLTAGTGVAAQLGAPFTTWSNAPGGTEDPKISTDVANSGTSSVKVVAGNDCVVHFSDITTGRYMISFDMYVDSGKVGYLNLLQNFAGANSAWGTQAFFFVDGTGTVDAEGASTANFNYTHDSWMAIKYIIDVDDDYASMFINNQHIVSWVWSKGSGGTGTLHKLDAINFYGWSDDNNVASLYYIDNFILKQVSAPEAPTNLTITVNGNDASLSWNAPAGSSPDYYTSIANGQVMESGITTVSYTESNLYPNTYNFVVRAFYDGAGFSASSNTASSTVAGGVERDLVLLEINTGTWCGYCPGAAMGADDMESNGHEVAIIEYHNGDDFVVADATTRENYYGVTAFPTSTFDGISGFSGGNATTTIYPSYLPLYEARTDYPSVLLTDLNLQQVSATEFNCTVTVTESNPYFGNNLKLRAALTESHIPYVWGPLTEVNFVCRQMYPDAAGTTLDFSTNTSYTTTFNINTTGFVTDECEFVVFIQHDASKEIVQTSKVHIENLIGITEEMPTQFNIYPNPSEGIFTLDILSGKNQSYQVEVMDVHGKIIRTFETNRSNMISKQFNMTDLSRGIYFIRITGEDDSIMKQIQIK